MYSMFCQMTVLQMCFHISAGKYLYSQWVHKWSSWKETDLDKSRGQQLTSTQCSCHSVNYTKKKNLHWSSVIAAGLCFESLMQFQNGPACSHTCVGWCEWTLTPMWTSVIVTVLRCSGDVIRAISKSLTGSLYKLGKLFEEVSTEEPRTAGTDC